MEKIFGGELLLSVVCCGLVFSVAASVAFCLGICIRMWRFAPEAVLKNSLHVRSVFLRVAVWNKLSGANFCFR